MTGVGLRPASGADAPAVTGVFLAARRAMTYLPELHTGDQAARFFFGLVTAARVEVAERDGAVIGFAVVRAGWLEHLNVLPAFQGAGVGSRLIGWAQQTFPAGLDLWVFHRNTGPTLSTCATVGATSPSPTATTRRDSPTSTCAGSREDDRG